MKKNTGYPSIDLLHEKDISFFKRHPLIPNMSINQVFELLTLFYRSAPAVDCLDLRVSFQELINDSVKLAKAMRELGIKQNDIVSVSMPNLYHALIVFFAANRLGATVTYLNYYSNEEEVADYLNKFESKLFIDYSKPLEYNKKIKASTKVEYILTLNDGDVNNREFNVTNNYIGNDDFIDFLSIGDIAKFQKGPILSKGTGSSDALILFTSGTTGAPKAVVLTNKNILAAATYLKNTTSVKNVVGEKSLVCVPFTYPYGFSTSTLMSLLCGREVILAPTLSSETIPYFYSKNPNIIFGSPAFLNLTMRFIPEGQDLSSSRVFISGGDFLTLKQIQEAIEFFSKHGSDIEISNGSGNAETVSCGTNSYGLPPRPGTAGRVLYGTSNIIIDPETNKELKYGEEGMLCTSGAHVFKEYYKDPVKTAEAKFKYKGKVYFKTGTRGFLREDGYFPLTGRDSRFYIIKTLNKVYCDRIQNIISGIDIVKECAVVKEPDDDMLFVNKAFIVLEDGVEPNEDTLEYIKTRLSGSVEMPITGERAQLKEYEIPASIEFVSTIPRKSGSEKVDYNILEEDALQEYNNGKSQKKLVL